MMTESTPPTDRDDAAPEAFATDAQLALRQQIHEQYSQPKIDFPQWVADLLTWRGDEWVLDVGTGSGNYFNVVMSRIPQGRLVAGDFSLGMLRRARQHPQAASTTLVQLDARHLPFVSGTFDVVLANHMLYHVPNIDEALVEIRRVLKPAGILVAATNAEDTMPEFDTLSRRACTLLGHPRQEFPPAHRLFALENGTTRLSHFFKAVVRHDLPSALHFREVQPVLDFVNSLRPLHVGYLPEDVTWEDFMDMMEKQVTRLIRHFGELQVHKMSGVLIATNGGGFAADYLRMLTGDYHAR